MEGRKGASWSFVPAGITCWCGSIICKGFWQAATIYLISARRSVFLSWKLCLYSLERARFWPRLWRQWALRLTDVNTKNGQQEIIIYTSSFCSVLMFGIWDSERLWRKRDGSLRPVIVKGWTSSTATIMVNRSSGKTEELLSVDSWASGWFPVLG
jgi:hypothetical protein